ncbi:FG-GAP repeat domain-containing protein [Streptomyces sp. NPDC093105]|uniref:FG-GAP repeat domain-containing protein n=1 Tax=Streptomyces sp. NPDC093105 TaxID=3366029 RepID=UPI0038180803
MNHRITGRRLAAALVTLATVTAVTGTLVTAPAMAAPAGATAERCVPSAAGLLPVGAEVVAAGAYGYLTSCTDENGEQRLTLHKPDGTVTSYGDTRAYDSGSDWIVTRNEMGVTAHNPLTGAYANHTLSGELAGVAYDVAYESRPTADGLGRELWQLTHTNGVVSKLKLSNLFKGERETAHKVVAAGRDADGRPTVLIMGQGEHDVNGHWEPHSWSVVIPVPTGSVVPYGYGPGWDWDAATVTGALTPKYKATVTRATDGGHTLTATVLGTTTVKRVPLTDIQGVPVLAGIVGDTAFYAARRDPSAGRDVLTPLYARNLATGGAPYKVMENFSSVARHSDGSLVVRGATASADGVFRIGRNGDLTPELVADTGAVVALKVVASSVPATANLEKAGTSVPMSVDLSRADADVQLTLTHNRTGKKLTTHMIPPVHGEPRFAYSWNGIIDGISAPNGAYTWQITAKGADGTSAAPVTGTLTVSRSANLHDVNDNGSTDVLARDAAGVLWRDDLYDWPVGGQVKPAKRTRIGTGWNTYKKIEAAGTIDGGATADLIAVDGSGVLWSYTGKGDGTFHTRVRVGGGWGVYTQLAAGSDWQTADRSSDLFAADTSGVLWYYRATGNPAKPYFPRIRVGGGWGVYNQITAVGNIVGDVGGELVARDKDGVLWLYQSNGFSFLPRVRIGGGWGGFSQLVGAGDVTNDGRPDLIAYGAGGTYVYRSNGTTSGAFTRQTTSLYAGEGGKFTSVS